VINNLTVADLIRTLVLMWGTCLGLVALKFAYISVRNGEGFRAYGLASYGLIVLTPVVIGLSRYDEPASIAATLVYVSGLICGTLALRAVVTLAPEWVRLLAADRKRRKGPPRDV
jgi:hypothetical protein